MAGNSGKGGVDTGLVDSAVRQASVALSVPRAYSKVVKGSAGVIGDGGERAGKEFGFKTGPLPDFQSARGRLRESQSPRMVFM